MNKTIEIANEDIERIETDEKTGKITIYLRGPKEGIEWGSRYMIKAETERFMGYFGYRRDRIKEC